MSKEIIKYYFVISLLKWALFFNCIEIFHLFLSFHRSILKFVLWVSSFPNYRIANTGFDMIEVRVNPQPIEMRNGLPEELPYQKIRSQLKYTIDHPGPFLFHGVTGPWNWLFLGQSREIDNRPVKYVFSLKIPIFCIRTIKSQI